MPHSDLPSLSYSALTTFEKCPELYRKKYVEKEVGIDIPKDYFLLGSLTHKILEFRLTEDNSLEIAYQLAFDNWLQEQGFALEQELKDNLFNYGIEYGQILHKASPCYLESDKYRKKDGSLLSSPHFYPSQEMRKDYEREDLDILKSEIDVNIARKYRFYSYLSLADVVARSYAYASNFTYPDWAKETLGVETDVSQTEKFGNYEWRLKGFIDWSVRIDYPELNDPIALLDFKTSQTIPKEEDVLWNPQLNLYAMMYFGLFGTKPQFIGIYHLPSGKEIMAEVSEEINNIVYSHYEGVADKIREANNFVKRFPTEYQSPCVSKDFKSNTIKEICPYLKSCWESYYREIEEETLIQTIENG